MLLAAVGLDLGAGGVVLPHAEAELHVHALPETPHPADRDRLRRLSASRIDPDVAVLAGTLHGMTHVLTAVEAARVKRLLDDERDTEDLDGYSR